MKYFAVLLVLAFVASAQADGLGEEQKEVLRGMSRECMASTGVNEDVVLRAREKSEFAEDVKLEEYYFCMFKKLEFINDAGELQEEKVRAKIPANIEQTKVDTVISTCKIEKGETPQKTSFLVYKCFRKIGQFDLL